MKFKWTKKPYSSGTIHATSGQYKARIIQLLGKYAVVVQRDIGNSKQASLSFGIWSDDGKVLDYMLTSIKAAKQKAEEFAKQLSRLAK